MGGFNVFFCFFNQNIFHQLLKLQKELFICLIAEPLRRIFHFLYIRSFGSVTLWAGAGAEANVKHLIVVTATTIIRIKTTCYIRSYLHVNVEFTY